MRSCHGVPPVLILMMLFIYINILNYFDPL
jgi:hypothetical protein